MTHQDDLLGVEILNKTANERINRVFEILRDDWNRCWVKYWPDTGERIVILKD